jgi:hypothetical protein
MQGLPITGEKWASEVLMGQRIVRGCLKSKVGLVFGGRDWRTVIN